MDISIFEEKTGFKSKTIIIATLISLFSLSLHAQNAPPAKIVSDKKENNEQDYSKGFSVFYKLGLPDVSKAEYVQFNSDMLGPIYSLIHRNFLSKVNAWLLKKEEGTSPASLIVLNAISITAYDGNRLFEEFKKKHKGEVKSDMEEYLDFMAENKSKTIAAWQEINIKEDIEEHLAELAETDKNSFSYRKEQAGPLFLYAIQIYSKGFKTEANKIISRLFELAGDKKIVLLSAMSSLADQQYAQAVLDLEKNGDWKKFADSLDVLLKKYPKGWKIASGVKLLHEMVQKQIANPLPPEIKGDGIKEEDKKFANELLNIKKIPYSNSFEWLLPSEKEKQNRFKDESTEKILTKGKDAIPILIALLTDDYMLPACNAQNFGFSKHGNEEKSAEDILENIPHPIKRKNIAKAILFPAVTTSGKNEEFNIMALDDEQLLEVCRKWYDEIKTKTPDELLLYYLKNGVGSQKHTAVMLMLQKDVEKNAAVIEGFFLDMKKNELISFLGNTSLTEYVAKRKKAALPFIEKLKIKFKDELAAAEKDDKEKNNDQAKKKESVKVDEDDKYDDSGLIANNPQARKELKLALDTLNGLAQEKKAQQIIDEILTDKNKQNGPAVYSQLVPMLKEMDKDEALGLLLYGISKTENNISAKNIFISLIAMLGKMDEYPSAQKDKKQEKTLSIEKNAEAWKKMLTDSTMCGEIKTSLLAAFLIDFIYGGKENSRRIQQLQRILGERCNSIVMKRAEERLAGKTEKELTPYPEIKELNEETTKKLVANLEKAIAEKKIGEFIKSMGYDEFAALPKIVSGNPKLNAELKDYANRIVSVNSRIKGEEKALDTFKDTVLDKGTVEKLQDYCEKLASQRKPFNCNIVRSPLLEGVRVEISDPSEYMVVPEMDRNDNINTPIFMYGSIVYGSARESARWELTDKQVKASGNEIVVDGKKVKLEKADQENESRDRHSLEKFLKCQEKAFEKDADSTSILFIDYRYMRY